MDVSCKTYFKKATFRLVKHNRVLRCFVTDLSGATMPTLPFLITGRTKLLEGSHHFFLKVESLQNPQRLCLGPFLGSYVFYEELKMIMDDFNTKPDRRTFLFRPYWRRKLKY